MTTCCPRTDAAVCFSIRISILFAAIESNLFLHCWASFVNGKCTMKRMSSFIGKFKNISILQPITRVERDLCIWCCCWCCCCCRCCCYCWCCCVLLDLSTRKKAHASILCHEMWFSVCVQCRFWGWKKKLVYWNMSTINRPHFMKGVD